MSTRYSIHALALSLFLLGENIKSLISSGKKMRQIWELSLLDGSRRRQSIITYLSSQCSAQNLGEKPMFTPLWCSQADWAAHLAIRMVLFGGNIAHPGAFSSSLCVDAIVSHVSTVRDRTLACWFPFEDCDVSSWSYCSPLWAQLRMLRPMGKIEFIYTLSKCV